MSELLQPGQVVYGETSSQPCRVDRFLGGGGQGEVYQVTSVGNPPLALKWYFPQTATPAQRAGLEVLVNHRPPSDRFLWPVELVYGAVPGFGYLMRLREPRYKGILDLMRGRADPTFRALATAGLGLADAFFRLHAAGLCYRDISFGNVFFDPATGDVLVCDNDNVTPNRTGPAGVLGTPNFMAPEIVRGEASPSRQTDLFSLAVLLFYMFHLSHPLFGRRVMRIHCLDLPARTRLCGTEPLFILDPDDRSNEAVDTTVDPLGEAGANALLYWPIYPRFFRDTFTRAFTAGLRDANHGRVAEGEWRGVLSRLRDAIYYCPACGSENFYDPQSAADKAPRCWSCGKETRLPYRLRLGRSDVMLTHAARLYPHHVDERRPFDFSAPVAEVARHPTDSNVWGLKNLTRDKWTLTAADGSARDVEPGRSAVLAPGVRIRFGDVEGEVRY